ncbi:hypothetical protein D5400_16760 [Georhizobium profundi]|jgi:hypothetical protein|uniref:DUF2267 domain-containing protein n=1 Tax=Georhizobium profundi TaxID=2341112 RepID=A0A3S9B6W6_9HYPH|nr:MULTISPECIES: hypothetical protein [Rhizobiaceae]AZN72702.1 hypothetical protein D5400_16760 [Georhizobium profundi]GLQ38654.1 hypothetical protein GCM10007908_22740 [Rhizobium albus]VVT13792.1 conserved hypothetical protein [Rhizobium sp. EC-SD404]
MDELISRITANVGIDDATARKAVGLILGFLQREGADGPAAKMVEGIPGGPEAVAEHGGEATGGGVMGLGQQLMSAGLGMGEISGVARETVAFAKQHVGEETVDQVVASIPGLSQFV